MAKDQQEPQPPCCFGAVTKSPPLSRQSRDARRRVSGGSGASGPDGGFSSSPVSEAHWSSVRWDTEVSPAVHRAERDSSDFWSSAILALVSGDGSAAAEPASRQASAAIAIPAERIIIYIG